MKRNVITNSILEALDNKHFEKGDIFATEIQSIPRSKQKKIRKAKRPKRFMFDAIAITKSFSKPCLTIYEIKSCREDFTSDNKWHNYIDYGNELYIVIPKDEVKKEEIDERVGLIYFNKDKGTLRTVRKASYDKKPLNQDMVITMLNRTGNDQFQVRELKREINNISMSVSRLKLKWKKRDTLEDKIESVCNNFKDSGAFLQNFKPAQKRSVKSFIDESKKGLKGKPTNYKKDIRIILNLLEDLLD